MSSLPPPTRPSTPDSVAETIERSRDEDEKVRCRAVLVLNMTESPAARSRLLEMAEDASKNVRFLVARSLYGKTGDDIDPVLKKLSGDDEAQVRQMARTGR